MQLTVLGIVGALLLSRPARADLPAIQWRAPEECGTREDFEAGVARIVGKPPSELGSSWSSAELDIELEQGRWQLRLVVLLSTGRRRERNVVAGTCREAVDAAELIVATSLSGADAEWAPENEASPTAPALRAAPAVKPAPEAARVPKQPVPKARSEPATPPRWTEQVGARFGVDTRLLPTATELGELAFGLERAAVKVELLVGATYPRAHAAGAGTATAYLLRAGVVGCYGTRGRRLGAWACAGAELGRFTAFGSDGLPNHHTSSGIWSAGLVQGEFSWALGRRFGLIAGAQGVLSFRQLEVGLSPDSPVYRTPRLDLRPWLGFELGFQ